jgi:hypothetical protein
LPDHVVVGYEAAASVCGSTGRGAGLAVEQGIVTPEMLRAEMRQNHVRHDAFEVMERAPPLAA